MTELRKCSRCRSKILLESYFGKNRKGEYYKTCNGCREKNKEKRKDYNKKWRERNKDKSKEYLKNWYLDNKQNFTEWSRKYYAMNQEAILQKKREYHTQMKDDDDYKKRRNIYLQQYRSDRRHYCEHNSIKQMCKECNPRGYLKHIISTRVRMALKQNKSNTSLEYLGCDVPTFREHLEKSFKEGMTWENHGKWHIDHIIPVLYKQDGVEPSIEEVGKRLHYTNCQAMWASHNISKGNKYIGDYQSESESI